MFDFAALDVALGLIFVYLILALICSAISETISSVFSWRAKFLREGIANLLDPTDARHGMEITERLYGHPLVNGLIRPIRPRSRRMRYPSYIPSRTFVTALLNLDTAGAARQVDESISAIRSPEVEKALRAILASAQGDVTRFQRGPEQWFDDAMERVSGWYRRRVQLVMWCLAIGIAGALNADTIRIAQQLWSDKAVRAAVVAHAESAGAQQREPDVGRIAQDVDELRELDLPIGWNGEARPSGTSDWILGGLFKTIGLLFTAAAITLGAPFWFDMLSKVARIRSAGAPPPASDAVRRGEGEEARAGPTTIVQPQGAPGPLQP